MAGFDILLRARKQFAEEVDTQPGDIYVPTIQSAEQQREGETDGETAKLYIDEQYQDPPAGAFELYDRQEDNILSAEDQMGVPQSSVDLINLSSYNTDAMLYNMGEQDAPKVLLDPRGGNISTINYAPDSPPEVSIYRGDCMAEHVLPTMGAQNVHGDSPAMSDQDFDEILAILDQSEALTSSAVKIKDEVTVPQVKVERDAPEVAEHGLEKPALPSVQSRQRRVQRRGI